MFSGNEEDFVLKLPGKKMQQELEELLKRCHEEAVSSQIENKNKK